MDIKTFASLLNVNNFDYRAYAAITLATEDYMPTDEEIEEFADWLAIQDDFEEAASIEAELEEMYEPSIEEIWDGYLKPKRCITWEAL